jgi:glucose-6-phosphate 1-dehydrogenase
MDTRQEGAGVSEEAGVNASSNTETFAALNYTWITGDGRVCRFTYAPASEWRKKHLPFTIQFRPVPHSTFPWKKREDYCPIV